MTPSTQRIISVLQSYRLPLGAEKELQEAISHVLTTHGVEHKREAILQWGDIIDFMCGGIGMEVKLRANKRALFKQCERYCRHDSVKEFILITNVPTGWPEAIEGKPNYVLNLSRALL